jgi:putative membrane protein
MLRKKLLAAFVLTLCTYAAAQTPPQKPEAPDPTPPPRGTMSFPPVTDVERQPLTPATFVARAAIANLKEIEAGQLALRKSEDPAVKELSQQMIDAHRAAQEELKTVAAQQQHLSVPAAVDEKNKKELQALSQLEGKAFDRKYLETLSADHDKAVALFDAARQTSELPVDLKSYASESLASTQAHRKTVHALRAAEGTND